MHYPQSLVGIFTPSPLVGEGEDGGWEARAIDD